MNKKNVNYTTHRCNHHTFEADEPFDWFVLSEMRRMRADEALTFKDVRHNNELHHNLREYAISLQRNTSKISFVGVEHLAMKKAYYMYDDFRPEEVLKEAKRLQSLFYKATKKHGWNSEDETTFNTWLKDEPGGSVRSICVKKIVYEQRRKKYPEFGLQLLRAIDYKYRTKVIGFKPHLYNGRLWNYYPVFDEETQAQWDKAQSDFDEGATRYYAEKASGGYCGD